MIGDDVEVTVLAVQGERVRLGIEAPSDVPVFRTEIYQEIGRGGEGGGRRTDVRPGARMMRPAGSTARPRNSRLNPARRHATAFAGSRVGAHVPRAPRGARRGPSEVPSGNSLTV